MEYKGDDFYCDVAIPKLIDLDIEYESENVLAFQHTKPFWPVHIVVVPKKHLDSLLAVADTNKYIFDEMLVVLQKLSKVVMEKTGSAAVLTNLGEYQDSKHLHFHIYSGEPLKR